MADLHAPLRLDASPTFGAPVFTLTYRAFPQRLPWWRRWWGILRDWIW
jgi:hypothetical protein